MCKLYTNDWKDAAVTANNPPLTTNLSLAPDHLAVRRHMPKPLQQCDLQLRIELRVPGDFDIGDGENSSIAEPCSKYK